MVDIGTGIESNRDKSFCNKAEINLLSSILRISLILGDVMALTPYMGQVKEIQSNLPKQFHQYVRTVDGFKERSRFYSPLASRT